MSLQIRKINVQNLGPITRFSAELGIFNLIYGHNEKGKTYLVEFLIRSLFRNVRQWKLRSKLGSGKVIVEGLGTGKMEFSLSKTPKMEDFWERESIGLPPDFSKLLVVKGAEGELSNDVKETDRVIIKKYLFGQEILDIIGKKISPTLQKAEIRNGIIVGNKQGEIKDRNMLQSKLRIINQLFDQIDKGYSSGRRKVLADQIDKLQYQLDQLERAKRYLAYQLSEEIGDLKKKKSYIDREKLNYTKEKYSLYNQMNIEYNRKKEDYKRAKEKSQHYEWLKSAKELYENHLKGVSGKSLPLFWILLLISAASAFSFVLLKISLGAVIALICVIIFALFHVIKTQIYTRQIPVVQERKKLEKEFKNRFGIELTGLPLLAELVEKISRDFSKSQLLEEQLSKELRELESLKQTISDRIFDLTGERKEFRFWDETIHEIDLTIQDLETQFHEKDKLLNSLKVAPSDYVTEKSEVTYSEQLYEKLQHDLDQVKNQLDEENKKLEVLKHRICDLTDDEFTVSWETLIQNLREKREKILNEYKQKTAEIIGKIALHSVLGSLQKDEDTKIAEGLKSREVLEPLHQITGGYEDLRLDGENLIVSNSVNSFALSDLSTGVQEQVLLAFRIGFARKILKHDQMFLILDDAFQYSDWKRRGWLMDVMVDLAKIGWQIIYFTMDDHIKALFESKGKNFGDQYRAYELSDETEKRLL